MLLRPFRIENLIDAYVNSFGKIADGYGQHGTADLLRTWFGGDQPAWAYGGGQERPRWLADRLPGLCAGLQATRSAGALAARQILDLAWEWLRKDIATGLASSSPGYRGEKLGGLGKPLASVLTAAAAIGAAGTRDVVSGHIRKQEDAVTALEMSALRAAAELARDEARGNPGFADLAADCAARLGARLARPHRAPGDWSIGLPAGGCTCDLCDTLRVFLEDRAGAHSSGRSPSSAGSTSTPGSTPPDCPSPTRPGGKAALTRSSWRRPRRCSPGSRRRGSGTKRIWSGSRHSGISALDQRDPRQCRRPAVRAVHIERQPPVTRQRRLRRGRSTGTAGPGHRRAVDRTSRGVVGRGHA